MNNKRTSLQPFKSNTEDDGIGQKLNANVGSPSSLNADDNDTRNKRKTVVNPEKLNANVLSFNHLPYAQLNKLGNRKQSSFGFTQCRDILQKTDNTKNVIPSQMKNHELNYQPLYTPNTFNLLSSPPIMTMAHPYHTPVDSNRNVSTPSKFAKTPATIHIQRTPLSDITSNETSINSHGVNHLSTHKQQVTIDAGSENIPVTKRGRGRPLQTHIKIANVTIQAAYQNSVPPIMRRGRPKKSSVTVGKSSESEIADVESSQNVSDKPRRPRGRPRKLPQQNANESVQNTNVSMGVGSSSPNLYTPNAKNAIPAIDNTFTCSPIIQSNVNTATTTNAKGKSISIIPDFEPYDEDTQDTQIIF
ncbi:ATP-dependent DNA helicase PIF1 [Tanacetum coccineum]